MMEEIAELIRAELNIATRYGAKIKKCLEVEIL